MADVLGSVGEQEDMVREQHLLRLGAACLLVGSLRVLDFPIARGDLPTDTGQASLSYVAAYAL
jgi:hypothetical protein